MSLHDYLEKQRAKPVKEREKIAVIWTAIGFAIILVIWAVSFREMNKSSETQPVDQTSASLNDLKDNFNEGKDSIQNMMQQLPDQTGSVGVGNTSSPANNDNLNTDSSAQFPGDDSQNSQDNTSVPQLP